jgi:hypothetical protein
MVNPTPVKPAPRAFNRMVVSAAGRSAGPTSRNAIEHAVCGLCSYSVASQRNPPRRLPSEVAGSMGMKAGGGVWTHPVGLVLARRKSISACRHLELSSSARR